MSNEVHDNSSLSQLGGGGEFSGSRIIPIGKAVCGALFFTLFIIMIMEVTNRFYNIFDIRWSEEMARTLLVWIVFLGFGLACGADQNIKADLTGSLEEGVLRRVLDGLAVVITFALLMALIVVGLQLTQIGSNSRMVSVDFSAGFVLASVPTGAAIGAALLLLRAFRVARRKSSSGSG